MFSNIYGLNSNSVRIGNNGCFIVKHASESEILSPSSATTNISIESASDYLDSVNKQDVDNIQNFINYSVINGLYLTEYVGGLYTVGCTVSAGKCRSDDDTENMELNAPLLKSGNAAWSQGNNAGALDSVNVIGDTIYAVFLIKDIGLDTVDVLFSQSFSSPSLPIGYTKKRLIGAFYTLPASPDVYTVHYSQLGRFFSITDTLLPLLVDDSNSSSTYQTATLKAPPKSRCFFCVRGISTPGTNNTGVYLVVKTKGSGETQPSKTSDFHSLGYNISYNSFEVGDESIQGFLEVYTDHNSQIEYACTDSNGGSQCRLSLRMSGFEII